jgi:hypothetical protein
MPDSPTLTVNILTLRGQLALVRDLMRNLEVLTPIDLEANAKKTLDL